MAEEEGLRAPFTVYEHKGSPFWWVNFRIQGERVRLPTGVLRGDDPNQEAARREAAALWLAECDRRGSQPPSLAGLEADTLTLVAQFVDSDLAARARKRGPRYAGHVEGDLVKYVARKFPLISQITTNTWERACGDWHAKVKLQSIKRVTVSARLFLRYCNRVGAIQSVPTLPAPLGEEISAETAERRGFTAAERNRFLAAVKRLDARAHRIYTVLLYSALRKSGCERMLPRWIDFKTGYLTLPPSAQKRKKRAKSFYLHPKARAAIRAEMALRGDLSPDRPVFGLFNYDGHRGRRKREGLFWEAVRAAKIPEHGLTAHHVTRHTACTIAGNDGGTLAELMALGGWETPAMAMRYMHLDAKQSRGAVERL